MGRAGFEQLTYLRHSAFHSFVPSSKKPMPIPAISMKAKPSIVSLLLLFITATPCLFAQTPYATVVSNDAPALYWNFDEASGAAKEIMPVILPTSLNDLSPSNTASRISHDSLGSGLKLGNAASLVIGDYFYTGNLTLPTNSLSGPWAIEFWMQVQDTLDFKRNDYLMGFGTGGNHPGLLYDYVPTTNRYTLELFASGSGRTDGENGPPIGDFNWHHILMVYYGNGVTGVSGRLDMYVDGTNAAANIRNNFSQALSLTQICIGTSSPGFAANDGFWGNLDEVAIYNLANLTNESQVTAKVSQMASTHYALASTAASPEDYSQSVLADGPFLYWNFNEADGKALQLAPLSSQLAQNNLTPGNGATRISHVSSASGLNLGNMAAFSTNGEYFRIAGMSFPIASLPPPYMVEFWMQAQGVVSNVTRFDYVANFANNAPAVLYDYAGANTNGGLELFGGGGRTGFGPGIEDHNWHYLLFVNYGDGVSGVADRLDIYLDGTNAAQNIRASYDAALTLNGAFTLGTSQPGFAVADGFQGNLDEFAIYNLNQLSTESDVTAKASDIASRHFIAAQGAPSLSIASVGGLWTISWPGTATGYHLQAASPLTSSWVNVSDVPSLVDGKFQVTISTNRATQFFRLSK